jgi:hypothetical protein
MPTLDPKYLTTVLSASESPCVSIYQPAHRMHPENAQDPIRFKNLVKQVEESLDRAFRGRDTRPLLDKLNALARDAHFWNHTLDGVAVLASDSRFDVFTVARKFPELAVVADSFHLKPLLRYVQSADRFRVLALSRDKAVLFEGNRYALDAQAADGFPVTLTELLGEEKTEPRHAVRFAGPGGPKLHHGQGSRQDEIDIDTERFFRGVAGRLPTGGGPLVLAALAEHQTPFRAVCRNPDLLPDGVVGDPFALAPGDLLARAWAVIEPGYLARLKQLTEDFGTASGRGQGTGDLSDAARAAVAGRVGRLLIDADRVLPGQIDPHTGAIRPAELADPKTDDLLDDLAELVLRTGGDVVVVPTDRMPTKTGLAAIYRY